MATVIFTVSSEGMSSSGGGKKSGIRVNLPLGSFLSFTFVCVFIQFPSSSPKPCTNDADSTFSRRKSYGCNLAADTSHTKQTLLLSRMLFVYSDDTVGINKSQRCSVKVQAMLLDILLLFICVPFKFTEDDRGAHSCLYCQKYV